MKLTNNTRIKSDFAKIAQRLGLVFSLIGVLMTTSINAYADAAAIRSGFNTNTLAANDDGSTGLVPLGFDINFFGTGFNQGYVNNNGNITFDQRLGTFTPFGLTSTQRQIIAPFFADVDTRQFGSNPVTYGQGTVGSRPAFGVNWINVACFATVNGGYNTFQMVLIDRSDIGAGDFDIEFNYGSIVWETGTASGGNSVCQGANSVRVGYSNGSTSSFELAGSGVNGAFLDSNPSTALSQNNRNSLQAGRYVFPVRNGNAPIGHSISGTIFGNDNAHPLLDSLVQICTTTLDTFCSLTSTNPSGQYTIGGLADRPYEVKAFPPAGTNFQTGSIPVTIAGVDLTNQDITLLGPQPLPNGTSIVPNLRITPAGLPVIYWNNALILTTHGCPGGTANYVITRDDNGSVIASSSLAESTVNPGTYSTVVPALFPNSGQVTVHITFNCPVNTPVTPDIIFSMYIDPSGIVKDTLGRPVDGATVTLFRSDSSAGPFVAVPNGDAIMSPINRNNPSFTNAQGLFGWDVVAGFYKVRAEKAGCTAPLTNTQQNFVETGVLTIPPPVTDITLTLSCPEQNFAVCDVNQDGSVSSSDISIISRSLRSTVPVGTSGDINRDGRITTQDTRSCTLQCTLPRCAELPAA